MFLTRWHGVCTLGLDEPDCKAVVSSASVQTPAIFEGGGAPTRKPRVIIAKGASGGVPCFASTTASPPWLDKSTGMMHVLSKSRKMPRVPRLLPKAASIPVRLSHPDPHESPSRSASHERFILCVSPCTIVPIWDKVMAVRVCVCGPFLSPICAPRNEGLPLFCHTCQRDQL